MFVSSTWGIAAPATWGKSRLAGSATRPMVIDPAEPPPDPPVEPPVDPGFVDDPAVHALTARASSATPVAIRPVRVNITSPSGLGGPGTPQRASGSVEKQGPACGMRRARGACGSPPRPDRDRRATVLPS